MAGHPGFEGKPLALKRLTRTAGRFDPEASQPEVFTHAGMDGLHLIVVEHSQPSHQTHSWRGLNLLQMEGSVFQKSLGDTDFPAVATQRGRVGNNRDQRQFVVIRISGE
jgi:hypothetical protein